MKTLNFARKNLAIAVAVGSGLLGTNAYAQSQVLEEVIVTAQKREQSVMDVPISIGVMTGTTIDKFDISDMTDLQSFMPSLTVQSTFGNYAVRIRGIGSGVTNLAFDSSVTVYNDGVYCGRSKCLESAFLDVDRIEVARGPQGALFGKSTVAGAISMISRKPTDEFEGYVRGNYDIETDTWVANAVVSGPLTDTLRGRIATSYTDTSGWVKNPFVSDDEPDGDNWIARGALSWDASDTTTFDLKVEGGNSNTDGRSNQLVSDRGLFPAINTDPNPEYKPDDKRRVSTGIPGKEDFIDADFEMATLTMNTELWEHSLVGIANYWSYDQEWFLDVDGTPDAYLNTYLSDEYDSTSFELRALSPTGGTFEYIAGAWYQDSNTKTKQYSPFAPAFFEGLGLPPFLIAPVPNGMDRNFDRDTSVYSIYAQLTWNITDKLSLITDVRYTDEEQDGKGWSLPQLYPDGYNGVYAPPPPSYAGFNAEYHFKENRSDDNVDPAVRLQYDVNDDIMVYAVYAEGSKPGGLKANDGSLGDQLLAVDDPDYYQKYVGQPTVTPQDMIDGVKLQQGNGIFDFEKEEAKNYEIGGKMTFLDGAASLTTAIFHMEFDNLQTSSYDGTRFIIGNAASAEVDGAEVELTWQASEYLRLQAMAAYIDASYSDYTEGQCPVGEGNIQKDPDCVDGQADLDGEPLERSPEWEGNILAFWSSPLTSTINLVGNASVHYSDEYWVRVDYAPKGKQDSFYTYDARVGLAAADDKWEVAVIGRNLSDEYTIQHAYEIAGSEFQNLSQGRTVSLDVIYRF